MNSVVELEMAIERLMEERRLLEEKLHSSEDNHLKIQQAEEQIGMAKKSLAEAILKLQDSFSGVTADKCIKSLQDITTSVSDNKKGMESDIEKVNESVKMEKKRLEEIDRELIQLRKLLLDAQAEESQDTQYIE